ncbi:MAG TPA: mandelate racemase/muconate lactonizing enzyme family protein [Pseudolysinimonas sp.]|nr:mandelate racemase/muconate lactonizing enzyme family protein [Pseudolysinimonas sp.]
MKITGYRCLHTVHDWRRRIGDANGVIASGLTEVDIVMIDTDEGVTGVGVGSDFGVDHLFRAIEGEDPRSVTALYDRMLSSVFKSGHNGDVFGGIGVIDMALWDIKAKLAGEPLWRLLGARDRFVPGYASGLDIALTDDELSAFYRTMAERGFSSGKLKGGLDVDRDLARLEILESELQANAPRPALMLDANESWNLKQAVRYISRIEQSRDLTWIEEPLRRWDAPGHAALSRSINAAVATGENLTGLEQFAPLFDQGSVDVVQVGGMWGITHLLRVAAAAHARNLPVSPIGLTSCRAVAHAAAAIPNHLSTEVQDLAAPLGISIDQEITDGGIVLGNQPGSGISVDESALVAMPQGETSPVENGPHTRPLRAGLKLSI